MRLLKIKSRLTVISGFAVVLWTGVQSIAQPVTTDTRVAFEVASIKLNISKNPPSSNFPLGPGDAYVPNGGLFSATNLPLITYLTFAYEIMGDQMQNLVSQLPNWATTERFDIQARAQGSPGKREMRLMMQSLLADRFKLVLHQEDRDFSVFGIVALKQGNLGPQLRAHPMDSPCSTTLPQSGDGSARTSVLEQLNGFPTVCHAIIAMRPKTPHFIRVGGRDVTLEFIAANLSGKARLGRPLIDQTGLNGTFDFVLEWEPARNAAPTPGADSLPDVRGPQFEDSLREQLGLKLVSEKRSMSVIVIDHVERPSKN